MKTTLNSIKAEVVRLFNKQLEITEFVFDKGVKRGIELRLDAHAAMLIQSNSKAKSRELFLDMLRFMLKPEEVTYVTGALALAATVTELKAGSSDCSEEVRQGLRRQQVKYEEIMKRLEKL